MANTRDTPPNLLEMFGRVVVGLWAVNFVLMITDTVTYDGQSQVSFALAAVSLVLLVLQVSRRKSSQ